VNQAALEVYEHERQKYQGMAEACPFILPIKSLYFREDKLYLVLEFIQGRDLSFYLE
jgi:hypothetical protein